MQSSEDKEGWITYPPLKFEHSDTCVAKKFENKLKKLTEQEIKDKVILSENSVKLAVCCFILDAQDRVLLMKTPEFLKVFPNRWVLPGCIVNSEEPAEIAAFRVIETEIGWTFEYNED